MEVLLNGEKIGEKRWVVGGNKPIEIVFMGFIPIKNIVFVGTNDKVERMPLAEYQKLIENTFAKKSEAKTFITDQENVKKLASIEHLEGEIERLKAEVYGDNG